MPKSQSQKTSSRTSKPTGKKTRESQATIAAEHGQLTGPVTIAKQSYTIALSQRKLVVRLVLLAWLAIVLVSGLTHMTYYGDLSQSTDDISGGLSDGPFKYLVEIAALTISLMSGAANGLLSEGQQLYVVLGYLLVWLVLVWLLRHMMNGTSVRLRDGLYNAPAPLLPTLGLVTIALLQLVPLALLVSLLSAIAINGVFAGIVWTLVLIVLSLLAAAATLYWLIGTLVALIVVTVPGTYPLTALRQARALVSGYRRQLLGRVAWLLLVVILAQIAFIVPVIALDAAAGYRVAWLVAGYYQLIMVASYVYAGTYMYVLYRRLIDERS